jgi:hypothetical protein
MTAWPERDQNPASPRRLCVRALLVLLLALGGYRLLAFGEKFARRSLQQDFAAYYTAGESLEANLSPYLNYAGTDPAIWDGAAGYSHSRFLYPPLAATLFRPLARLHYAEAKRLWLLLSDGFLAVAIVLTTRLLALRVDAVLAGLAAMVFSFPLLTQLERGQIDLLTLALILSAVALMARGGAREAAGGALLALATLFKLTVLGLVPFLVLRRRWRALGGYGGGTLLLVLVSLGANGPAAVFDYWQGQLPRIVAFGESGNRAMRLPTDVRNRLVEGLPPGVTVKDGRKYEIDILTFQTNASFARSDLADSLPLFPRGLLWRAIIAFAVLLALAALRWHSGPKTHSPADELRFWQAALVILLLASPLTWVMNAVWALPAGFLLASDVETVQDRRRALRLAVGLLGFLLLALPDLSGMPLAIPRRYHISLFDEQYVWGELLLLPALLP